MKTETDTHLWQQLGHLWQSLGLMANTFLHSRFESVELWAA